MSRHWWVGDNPPWWLMVEENQSPNCHIIPFPAATLITCWSCTLISCLGFVILQTSSWVLLNSLFYLNHFWVSLFWANFFKIWRGKLYLGFLTVPSVYVYLRVIRCWTRIHLSQIHMSTILDHLIDMISPAKYYSLTQVLTEGCALSSWAFRLGDVFLSASHGKTRELFFTVI